jgi:hypothetical protein
MISPSTPLPLMEDIEIAKCKKCHLIVINHRTSHWNSHKEDEIHFDQDGLHYNVLFTELTVPEDT